MAHSIRTQRIRSLIIGFAVCSCVAGSSPFLFRTIGALVVGVAIPLALGLLGIRRLARETWLRATLAGASVGLVFIFAYAFSPPVLERIGHEFGWPGRSLRMWEKFTAPVYLHCCTAPWFWRVFEIWDTWTAMIFERTRFSVTRIPVVQISILGALFLGFRYLRSTEKTPKMSCGYLCSSRMNNVKCNDH